MCLMIGLLKWYLHTNFEVAAFREEGAMTRETVLSVNCYKWTKLLVNRQLPPARNEMYNKLQFMYIYNSNGYSQ